MSMLGLCILYGLAAQSTAIQWSNPSFEDIPGPGRPPLGWYFCGPAEETPPDVQPVERMHVYQKAIHGKTYAGLVVRDNNTQETLGQALDQPLLAGHCYMLRFYTCRSANFASYSRLTLEPTNFTEPVKLQIWAGNQHCNRQYLLAETKAIADTSWQINQLILQAPADCDQVFFSAIYHDSTSFYNGHLMIDNLSPILPVDCTQPKALAPTPDENETTVNSGDLTENIRQELSGVEWVRNGFSLLQDFFPSTVEGGGWIVGNQAIYQISSYLKAQPDALLTVVVGPRKDPLIQHHIRLLAAEFMASGLPPGRCLIRPIKKRDLKKRDWLNAGEDGADLLWGLSH